MRLFVEIGATVLGITANLTRLTKPDKLVAKVKLEAAGIGKPSLEDMSIERP